jgi:hypothetical protein
VALERHPPRLPSQLLVAKHPLPLQPNRLPQSLPKVSDSSHRFG